MFFARVFLVAPHDVFSSCISHDCDISQMWLSIDWAVDAQFCKLRDASGSFFCFYDMMVIRSTYARGKRQYSD